MNGVIENKNNTVSGASGANGIHKDLKHRAEVLEVTSSAKASDYDCVQESKNYIFSRIRHKPTIGIICGSGLGKLADLIEDADIISYSEIPYFATSTVPGHAGRLVVGKLSGENVACMQGRVHFYEGQPQSKVTFPIRVLKLLGVETLLLTNAAGGLNPDYNVGDIMIIKDHISLLSLAGFNPLVGPNDDRIGPRFFPMSDAYDRGLRKMAKDCADEMGFDFVREGVYLQQAGPAFETVGECRMMRLLEVDVVGMSTTAEVIVARHCGLRVLAMSLVTNECVMEYDSEQKANHEEVLATAERRSTDMQNLVASIVGRLGNNN